MLFICVFKCLILVVKEKIRVNLMNFDIVINKQKIKKKWTFFHYSSRNYICLYLKQKNARIQCWQALSFCLWSYLCIVSFIIAMNLGLSVCPSFCNMSGIEVLITFWYSTKNVENDAFVFLLKWIFCCCLL